MHLVDGNALECYTLVGSDTILYTEVDTAQCVVELQLHDTAIATLVSLGVWCRI